MVAASLVAYPLLIVKEHRLFSLTIIVSGLGMTATGLRVIGDERPRLKRQNEAAYKNRFNYEFWKFSFFLECFRSSLPSGAAKPFFLLRVRAKISLQIFGVEAPGRQGAKKQEYQVYSEFLQRSRAGCIDA